MSKTYFDNYDQSSSGLSIELSIKRCNDTAGFWWRGFKDGADGMADRIIFSGRNGVDFIVMCRDKHAPFYSLNELKLLPYESIVNIAYRTDLGINAEAYSKDELIDEILDSVCIESAYKTIYESTLWRELPYDFIATGYSQGDAAKVMTYDDGRDDEWYRTAVKTFNREYIQHLLYDSPIHGCVSVNSTNIYLDEIVENIYRYDRKEVKEACVMAFTDELTLDQLTQLSNWLNEALPEHLEYV